MVVYVDDDATGGDDKSPALLSVSCSICLELVVSGERSVAKLQCGHDFHLDCIGSAFNMKGAMECPNCRNTEGGTWMFANTSARSLPDVGVEELTFHEEPDDITYSEIPFGVHWCPFSGLNGVHSSFEEVESPPTIYHDFLGSQATVAEHIAASSLAHSGITFVQPVPPATANLSESFDDPFYGQQRNGQPGHAEIYDSHALPAMSVQYQSWSRTPPFSANVSHINGGEQASIPPTALRSDRADTDAMTRSGAIVHPFLYGRRLVPRGGSSFVSTMVHHGSNTQSHERIQVVNANHHPQQPNNPLFSILPGVGRFNSGPRGLPLVMLAHHIQPDHHHALYLFPHLGSSVQNSHEAENPVQWERDHGSHFQFLRNSGWESSQHTTAAGTYPNNMCDSFWVPHSS